MVVDGCTATDVAEVFYMTGNYPMAILFYYEERARQSVVDGIAPEFGYDTELRLSACYNHVSPVDSADAFAQLGSASMVEQSPS